MNNENDKKLDDLFKKKLEDPVDQFGYREEDWDSLELMLDKQKRKRSIVYLLPILSGVAALLLLFLGWWLFRPQNVTPNTVKKLQAVASYKQQGTAVKTGGSQTQPQGLNNKISPAVNYAGNLKNVKYGSKNKPLFTSSANGTRGVTGNNENSNQHTANNLSQNILPYAGSTTEPLLAQRPVQVFSGQTIDNEQINVIELPVKNAAVLMGLPANKKVTVHSAYHTQFALSVLAAPDINGVGSFQQSRVGTNAGLQLSAGITRKLTIITGVIYSVKPYVSGFGDYHTEYQFAVDPTSVAANCRMLDIPLNIGYQIYNKHQNKLSLGTGLSSYIMLHESYTFNYASADVTGPTRFTVPNSGSYLFGVLNINATYEHQLNEKVGVSIQPYLKLPLTNIGYSQVRLQTTGVAIGLRWNLNSMSKP